LNNKNTVFFAGFDTTCRSCTSCGDSAFVSKKCTATEDTECTDCKTCGDNQYIGKECQFSESPTAEGINKVCSDCSPLAEEDSGRYVTKTCNPMDANDFVYDDCTPCVFGEFEEKGCFFGGKDLLGEDRVCESCDSMPGCQDHMIECTQEGDSVCTRCQHDGYAEELGTDYFEKYETCCSGGYLGLHCEWQPIKKGCDASNQSFMERTARRGGFWSMYPDETSGPVFVGWCKDQCFKYDDCTAFEVEDCIVDGSCEVVAATTCNLKNHVNVRGDGDDSQTCFVKSQ
jgi:hypothetical protein